MDESTPAENKIITLVTAEYSYTNETNQTVMFNANQTTIPDDWSYNFWPIMITIMPIVTVGGNLLVIVSFEIGISSVLFIVNVKR